ncbi:MAG: hypothetical protein BWY50_01842 [Spirochaetes bacterium ADurb.Bin315]|nr:MAG: hypothetical protein BWY50_01842 [Spirochaetes bacterium ADurb.Bin315]
MYCCNFLCPEGSEASFFNEGITSIKSCRMICVLMYGITPSMKSEKLENAPPLKKFKYSVRPIVELELWARKNSFNTCGSIPGIGITAPILLTTSNPRVMKIFLRRLLILYISTKVFAMTPFFI